MTIFILILMFRHIAPYLNAIDFHLLKDSYQTLLLNQVSELIVICFFCVFIKKMMNSSEIEFKNRIKMKNRFKKLLDISPEGIIVMSGSNQIEYMND